MSNRTIKFTGISDSDFIGCGNFATATKSQSSSYKPIVVINGKRNEPVLSEELFKRRPEPEQQHQQERDTKPAPMGSESCQGH